MILPLKMILMRQFLIFMLKTIKLLQKSFYFLLYNRKVLRIVKQKFQFRRKLLILILIILKYKIIKNKVQKLQ